MIRQTKQIQSTNTHLQSELDDGDTPVPNLAPSLYSLSSLKINKEEVCAILNSLATGKACGPVHFRNRVLKEVTEAIAEPLTDLFSLCLSLASVPEMEKSKPLSYS